MVDHAPIPFLLCGRWFDAHTLMNLQGYAPLDPNDDVSLYTSHRHNTTPPLPTMVHAPCPLPPTPPTPTPPTPPQPKHSHHTWSIQQSTTTHTKHFHNIQQQNYTQTLNTQNK